MTGQYEEALALATEARRRNPKDIFGRTLLSATYTDLGRDEDARESDEFESANG